MTESAKLAFADREAYYGDPKFDDVPMDVLLSDSYSQGRRDLIGETASMEMRPGDVGNGVPEYATIPVAEDNRRALGIGPREVRDLGLGHAHMGDTTHLDAVDSEGNMVAATPSGGWIGTSPVVKGLGLPMGTRGQMFYLNPGRPNALAPRKRPRATLTPVPGDPQRRAVHGVRHPRRRWPGPVDPPVPPQLRRLRDGPAGGAGRPDGPHRPLPVLVLPPPVLPRQARRGKPHPARRHLRPGRHAATT